MKSRNYQCLSQQQFRAGNFELVPLRDEDKYEIMRWRNEQIDILRQKNVLTKEQQEKYFDEVVANLFLKTRPDQLLFSVLEEGHLIGYGGLVHIDWESGNAEVSFITATNRNMSAAQFIQDWKDYLHLIKMVAFEHLKFVKIYTYAYDIRPNLYVALGDSGFVEEARLKRHVRVKGKLADVLIHSCFFNLLHLRLANEKDLFSYFNWVNDPEVRRNSFNQDPITFENHQKWFSAKIESPRTLMFIASAHGIDVGQIRFDEVIDGEYEIDFSIGKEHRGKGIGTELIKEGTKRLMELKPSFKNIIGKVKNDNRSSKSAFLNAGYRLISSSAELDVYAKI